MDTGEQEEESSARRRERLLALRSAAASSSSSAPAPPEAAAWDLPEPDLMGASNPRPPPRFDFYTNPGAAFSSAAVPHKRKSAYSPPPSPAPAPPCAGSENYGNNYPPPRQYHMSPSPIHSPYLTVPSAPGSSPWRSPMQFQNPVSGYRGPRPGARPHWNPISASPAQDSYPYAPSFGFRGANAGRRGTGRGRSENFYNNSGSGGRGRRGGRGDFQNHSGWQDRRDYNIKDIVDDPWRELHPIVGNILIPSKSWLPASLRAKKDTSTHGQIKPPSGLSLAEYLDLSFNEASNET